MRHGQILPVAGSGFVADAPVVGVAAVAHRDVEHLVGAEADPVTVVVELRPRGRGQDALGIAVREIGIVGRDGELGHDVAVVPPEQLPEIALEIAMAAIGHVELPVGGEVGVEGEAEQPALVEVGIAVDHQAADVEERRALKLAVLDDHHPAPLLDDEHAAVAGGLDHRQRRVDAGHKGFELDFRRRERGSGDPHGGGGRQGGETDGGSLH